MNKNELNYTDVLLSMISEYIFQYDVKTNYIEFFKSKKQIMGRYCSIEDALKLFMINEEIDPRQYANLRKIKNAIVECHDSFKIQLVLNNKRGNATYEFYGFHIAEVDKVVGKISIVNDEENVEDKFRIMLDPLTETLRKESIMDYAINEILKNNPFTIMIIDIDNFALINDTFGHLSGDKIIHEVALALKKELSYKGQIGRLGEDEFLVILHDARDYRYIWEVCRMLRSCVEFLNFSEYKNLHITCTIGTSSYPSDGKDYDTLFKKADRALYRGKAKGRNCFIIYDEEKHGKIDDSKPSYLGEYKKIDNNMSLNNIINDTFDILNDDSHSLQKNIETLFDKIGTIFGLDRICFLKRSKQEKTVNLCKTWVNNIYQESAKINLQDVTNDDIDKIVDKHVTIFNNLDNLEFSTNSFIRQLRISDTKSVVIAMSKIDELTEGFILFEMCSKRRVWMYNEINYFTVCIKLIATLLNK